MKSALPVAWSVCLVLAAQAAPAKPLTGDDAVALVSAAMQAAGVAAPQMAAPLRNLPDCDHPPRVTPLRGSWATAELTCDAPTAWVRLLRTGSAASMAPPRGPEAASDADASMMDETVLATRALRKGHRLGPDDLVIGKASGLAPAHRLESPDLAIGRRLRVAVGAGQPILERQLEAALDVEAQQTVTALLTASGIEISLSAVAIAGGVVGDRIPLQTPWGRQIDGIITANGIVRIRSNIPRRTAVTLWKRRLSWSIPSTQTRSRVCDRSEIPIRCKRKVALHRQAPSGDRPETPLTG